MKTRSGGIALVAGAILTLPVFAANTTQVQSALRAGALPTLKAGTAWTPSGKGVPVARPTDRAHRTQRSNGISYHGGPVMMATKTIYYIWYGSWSTSSAAVQILPSFASGIGGSPYFNINTTYTNGSGGRVSNSAVYGGATMVPAYLGNSLSDADILQIVSDAINGGLPRSSNAAYFVLTSADVNETTGFCTQYCGWHDHAALGGTDIKYSFVGDSSRCPSSCSAQSVGPNGSSGADGMASIIAHEFEETATDPDLNAWYDSRGNENGDKCAWNFGSTARAGNGAAYNQTLGGRQWLIQQNWVNAAGGYCAQRH